MNIADLLIRSAIRFPGGPAVTWQGRTTTYGELNDRSSALAHGLADRGVARHDRCVVFMDNRPESLEAMFAIFRIGAVVVPCNARSTWEELAHVVQDADAAVILTDPSHRSVALAGSLGKPVLCAERDLEDLRVTAAVDPRARVDTSPDDVAWLFYTSGTTGQPKGAMLTHGALNFVTVGWLAELTSLDESDVTLHAAPLSHGAGFHALAATAGGAHQVILDDPSFDETTFLEVVHRFGVTNTWLVPTQIIRVTAALEGRSLPSTLRRIVYGGAPIAPAALDAALDAFGPVFVQLYAQGESPMTVTVLRPEEHRPGLLASAGRPRIGIEVEVVDEAGQPVAPGEVGQVVVRGPSVMSGYWNRPAATAETLHDGWLQTGDLGRFDERGFLFLLDRTKDMIISGGSNVYAVEVEAVLAEQDGVSDVAVVGAPDPLWGERVEAVVVPTAGITADAAALDAACRTRLATYKVPRAYHVVSELPRNAYGKVLKSELRELVARETGMNVTEALTDS